tara:strand:- start:317 stop:1183 length:867 start_codon:yes stop_codon:yes gene_type:complete
MTSIRRFNTIFAFLCLLSNLNVNGSEPLQVMSFNIRFDNPRDGLDNWKFRATKVSAMFAKHDIGIAGLQEVKHHQLTWLKQALPDYGFVGVGRDDGKKKGEYAPLAYRKSDFELQESETIWLSETPAEVGSKGWDAALPRIATFAVLRHSESGAKLLAGSVHYDHVGVKARKNSGAVLAKYISNRLSDMTLSAVIVAGDFNCLPDSEPFKAVEAAGVMVDSFRLTDRRVGPQSTWNGFRAVQPGRRIDYVFVNKGVTVLGHLIDDQQVQGRFPSDHLPVVVKLKLKDR